jgi:hypothetical protein
MPKERPNHRQAWTSEQIAELMRLSRRNLTAQQIAVELGRTEEAIQLKARQHDLVLSKARPQPKPFASPD